MNKKHRKVRKLRKRREKLRKLKRRQSSSQTTHLPQTSETSDWETRFRSKYGEAILSVICQTQPLDPKCYSLLFALIAKSLSEGRLNVASGWLIVIGDPQQPPLILEHAWNEFEDGTRLDLSPWNDCPVDRSYVPRSERERVEALIDTRRSAKWHTILDRLMVR